MQARTDDGIDRYAKLALVDLVFQEREIGFRRLQLCFGNFGLVIPEETFVRDGCGYVRFADRRAAEEAKLMLDGEAGQV